MTILKPLKGLDDSLLENLATFFEQEYPGTFEIVFSVADADDSAVPVVRQAQARYPRVSSRVVVARESRALNPKIANLLDSYRGSSMEYVLISDSNVRVGRGYLEGLMAEARGAALASSLVRGVGGGGSLGALLESATMNTFVSRWIAAASWLGRVPVVGKSYVVSKRELDAVGGLRAFQDHADEDFLMGERLRQAGKTVVLSSWPAFQHFGVATSPWSYAARHGRWGRIRNSVALGAIERWNPTGISLATFAQEIVFNAYGSGLMGCVALWLLGGNPMRLALPHALLWSLCDSALMTRADPSLHPAKAATAWLARDAAAIGLWFYSTCGQTIEWRGHILKIIRGGSIAKAE